MPQAFREGQTATHKDGRRFEFSGGQWRQMQAEKVSPEDNKVVSQALLEAEQARQVASAAQVFMQHNARANTGLQYTPLHVHVPFFGEVGGNPYRYIMDKTNPDVASMESINAQQAPRLRPVGTGRLMQQEYQGFKTAFPNVDSTEPVNASLARDFVGEAAKRTAHSEFLENYLHAVGHLGGAQEAFVRTNGESASPGLAGLTSVTASTPRVAAPQRMRFDPKTGDLSPAQ